MYRANNTPPVHTQPIGRRLRFFPRQQPTPWAGAQISIFGASVCRYLEVWHDEDLACGCSKLPCPTRAYTRLTQAYNHNLNPTETSTTVRVTSEPRWARVLRLRHKACPQTSYESQSAITAGTKAPSFSSRRRTAISPLSAWTAIHFCYYIRETPPYRTRSRGS